MKKQFFVYRANEPITYSCLELSFLSENEKEI